MEAVDGVVGTESIVRPGGNGGLGSQIRRGPLCPRILAEPTRVAFKDLRGLHKWVTLLLRRGKHFAIDLPKCSRRHFVM